MHLERELLYQNPLARQLAQLPEFMEDINRNLGFVYLMESLPMKEIMDARRILITGCGDSYAAGIAMKPLLEEMLQMPVDVMRAVEFSRHLPFSCLEEGPGSPLVVLISVSGTVTRIPGSCAAREPSRRQYAGHHCIPQHPVGKRVPQGA